MINIGFIGTGRMGQLQAKAFSQLRDCRVAAGANRSEPALAEFAKAHPGATLYADYRQLLADPKIDAVVVSTPTFVHRDHAIDVLRSGRPVLVEKPMARTGADARRMIEVARKTGNLLMIAHCRRFDPDWATFAALVRKGTLGRPILWRQMTSNPVPEQAWIMDDRMGGGTMLDGAIHMADFANVIFGDPHDVLACSLKLSKSTATDTATAVIRYKSGDQAMFCRSWTSAPSGTYVMDALGPNGSVVFGAGTLNSPSLDHKIYGYYCLTSAATGRTKLIRYKRRDIVVEQARHFVNCIKGNVQCLSPATDAIKAIAAIEAMLSVARRGGVRKIRW